MMLSLFAAAAAALASAVPTIETIGQTPDGRAVIRLTFNEMASVTSAPLAGPVSGSLSTLPLRIDGSAFSFGSGVQNIAINNGIASTSQAVTNVSVTVALPRID